MFDSAATARQERGRSPGRHVPLLVLLVLLLPALTPAARADVPAFVDGPIGVTKDASSILNAILVEVRGPATSGDKQVHTVHVVRGDETSLVDVGVVADQSVEKDKPRSATWKVGGKSGMELVLGAFAGTTLKEYKERSGLEWKKKTMHVAELVTWSDARRLGKD